MSTIVQPPVVTPTTPARRRPRASTFRYWLAGAIAVVGLVSGVALGLSSYRDWQRDIDTLDRVTVPGAMTVQLDEADGRVVYFEGDDNIRFDDLTIIVTDPAGSAVDVKRYEGAMIYEDLDGTQGRAVATFNANRAGTYAVEVSGVNTGQIAVGDSAARRALPGALTGLGVAGLALIAGFILWLTTFINRSNRRTAIEPEENR